MKPRQKIVWSNPAAQQAASQRVPPQHLGRFTQPAARPFEGEEPEVGSLWFTTKHAWVITGAWDGTDAEEGQVAYLSNTQYRPSHRGGSKEVGKGTMMVYLGLKRLTEWDGKGWARPVRPTYIVDGVEVAVVNPELVKAG